MFLTYCSGIGITSVALDFFLTFYLAIVFVQITMNVMSILEDTDFFCMQQYRVQWVGTFFIYVAYCAFELCSASTTLTRTVYTQFQD